MKSKAGSEEPTGEIDDTKPERIRQLRRTLLLQFASAGPHVDNCCTCALRLLSNPDHNPGDRNSRQRRILPVLYLGGSAIRLETKKVNDLRRSVASRLHPETVERRRSRDV